HKAGGQQSDFWIGQNGEIGGQTGNAEKDRRKKSGDQPAQLFVDMPRADGGFADQQAGDKGTKDGMHANQVSDQCHDTHDRKDGRDHSKLTKEMIIYPADNKKNGTTAYLTSDHQEQDRANDAL